MNQPQTQNLEHYWQSFDMQFDPFSKDMDEQPPYLSLQWQQYLEFLSDLRNYQHALVLLTGAVGVGKSTLIKALLKKISSVNYAVLSAEACSSDQALLKFIEQQFAVPLDQSETLMPYDQANQQLSFLQHSNQTHLLVVEDADKLPASVQELILHFIQQQLNSETFLQIILVGEPKLVDLMKKIVNEQGDEKSQHLVSNLVLDPFERSELPNYLAHRFTQAGLVGEFPLSEEALDDIYQKSQGLAGTSNKLTATLLRGYFMEQEQHSETTTSKSLLKRYIWWIGTIAVIAILLIWGLPMMQHKQTVQPMNLPVQLDDQAADTNSDQTNPNPDYTQSNQQNLANANQNPGPTQPNQSANVPANTNTPNAVSNTATSTTSSSSAPVQTSSANAVTAPNAAEPENVDPDKDLTDEKQGPDSLLATDAPVKTSKSKKSTHKLKPNFSSKHHHVNSMLRETNANHSLSAVENQLLKVQPSYYTIQLFGSYHKTEAQAFIRRHKLENEAVYFHTYFNNRDWYAVITGDYSSYAQAKAAVRELPGNLRKETWVRSFASVHKSINLKS